MSKAEESESDALILNGDDKLTTGVMLKVDCSAIYDSELELDLSHETGITSLARSYEPTVNIFGRFKQELLSLPLSIC